MKRVFAILMICAIVFGLCACGKTDAGTASTAAPTAQSDKVFSVGYSKVNITPDAPTGLAGYGNIDERMHTEVLDYIYLTCVAITDTADTTVLFFSADLCSISDAMVGTLRTKANGVTGVPNENIMFNSSHTHSAPYGQGIPTIMNKAVAQAAKEAMDDRKPATMYYGKAETDGINFVRHYIMSDGSTVTDNHGNPSGKTYVGHRTEADQEMRILQFKREGGKDVIMVNWQSHPHITGGSTKTALSADIIGAFRTNMENDLDCLFAYYQGGGGNINPTSRIAEENKNSKKDWKVHGQMLASTAKMALQDMTQVETGLIQVKGEIYSCDTNKADLDLGIIAGEVRAYYEEGHTIAETQRFAETLGIASLYHANAIGSRGGLGDHLDIEINAISIGDFAWCLAPFEMFDTTAKYVRDNSPYDYTFVTGYSNGGNGYFPTEYCYEYGAYESDTTKVAKGTAEAIADHFVEMLTELRG